MNKRKLFQNVCLYFILLAGVVLPAGCDNLTDGGSIAELKIPREKLSRIDTLNPERTTAETAKPADANEMIQGRIQLTLEQCRAIAIENNLDLKVQLINPVIAAERVTEEQAKFESSFYSNINFSKTNTPISSGLSGSNVETGNVNLGVRMPMQTGGEVTFNLADNRYKTDDAWSVFNPSYSSDFSFSISQPLLRNAGRRANTYSIRAVKYQQQISDARTKLEVIKIIAAVDRVYWRLYAAKQVLDVRRKQYELAEAQLERARRFVQAGDRAQVELIRAEAGAARELAAIITAENDYRDRHRELKRVLNKPALAIDSPAVLVTASEPDPVHYDLDGRRLVSQAVDNRMEMLELELALADDMSRIDYLKNQALPLVTLDYTYNINGLGPTQRDSYDLLLDKDFEDHRVGLQVVIPLGNAAARSRLRQAVYQKRQRLATKESRQQVIGMEVLNALDRLEANWQQILAGRQSAILDGRLYEAEVRQFELGLRTSTDVLEAQAKFADSQSAEIRALTEYQISLVDVAYATGTLLGAAKIELEPLIDY